MKDYVASGAGYLQGGLQRENWERGNASLAQMAFFIIECWGVANLANLFYFTATLSIVKMTSDVTVHPGINFFIKHIGAIFRELFKV